MNKGRIALGTIIILILIPVVLVAAYLLKNQVEKTISKKPQTTLIKPPALQALIEPAIAEFPEAKQVAIVSNSDMYIDYLPEDDAFGVTILTPEKEEEVRNYIPQYFEALGVEDFESIKIDYRIKQNFSQE